MALSERLRSSLQAGAASLLEDGEAIEEGIRGHVGEARGGLGLIGLVVLFLTSASVERRVLLLTDRRVVYLHTGLFRPSKIEGVLGYWPIGAAPVRIVQLAQRGQRGSGTIVEVGGVPRTELASRPDGTVTEVRRTVSEQMHVAQPTLEEISVISELVEKAAGARSGNHLDR